MSRLLTASISGSARQRGRRHGELFGASAREAGLIDYYLGFCGRMLPHPSRAAGLAFDALHRLCARGQSAEVRGLIAGFAEATGFPESEVSRALVMPDVLNFLAGLGGRLQPVPALGCTSVAAWGEYTAGGRLLYGRNLDFPGNGVYDRFPLVLRHKPEQGIPYVSLTTAGGIVDGFTAVNAEGLTIALHQHLSRDIALWGTRPVLDLALEVLLNARSIAQAVALVSSWKTTSGWTFIFTHCREKLACAVERAPSRCCVSYARDGVFARTNDYAEPALREGEIDYTAWRQSSRLRHERARALLEERRGRVDAAAIASLLSDHRDAERGLERAFAQAIASPSNMTSVVIDPEAGVLWAAEGPAPVCEGVYRRVPLWEDAPPGEALAGVGPGLSPQRREGYKHYISALHAWERGRDEARCRARLADAVEADPQDPVYRYFRGLFQLRAGDAETALAELSQGAEQPDLPHRQRAQRLWQARCLDALGRRDEALKGYAAVCAVEGPRRPLGAAAERGLRKPYRAESAKSVMPDFFFGDVYAY